jgi:hypothetical protein
MEYYSVTKRNEALIYATKWVKLGSFMLIQSKQTIVGIVLFHSCEQCRIGKSIEMRENLRLQETRRIA